MKTSTLHEYESYLISSVVGFAVMAANANNTVHSKLNFPLQEALSPTKQLGCH